MHASQHTSSLHSPALHMTDPASKWEVDTDSNGNMYFYNALTGKSVWELPPEEEDDGDTESTTSPTPAKNSSHADSAGPFGVTTKPKTEFTAIEIAIEVADAMLDLLDRVDATSCEHKSKVGGEQTTLKKHKKKFMSSAAEARAKRNEANDTKRKKRLREKAAAAYLQIALPNHSDGCGGGPTTLTSDSSNGSAALNGVGSLFTLEDTMRWRLEREVARIKQRRVVRKERQAHQQHVLSLKRQQGMLKRFRTVLTTHFVSQIECSTELLQQRILLLSSPQQRAELESKRKAGMEPEVAERYAREQSEARAAHLRSVEEVFVLIDDGAQGRLHLLQILFGIFTLEYVALPVFASTSYAGCNPH